MMSIEMMLIVSGMGSVVSITALICAICEMMNM